MKRYRILVSYDGTNYAGWQVQPNITAIANKLENSFFYAFNKRIKLLGASRTDAGVHAYGQVAAFDTDLDLPAQKLQKVWNDILPPDIIIREIDQVSTAFCPRYDVAYKIYKYHIFTKRPLPFEQRYGYYFYKSLDEQKFAQALKVFEGTHDFSSFSSSESYKNPVRTIDSITVEFDQQFHKYTILFKGRSFLRFMIRRIVGACLEVASKPMLSVSVLEQALREKSSDYQFYNAPAQGLLLYEIGYEYKEIHDKK